MDSFKAFELGEINRNKEEMVFDWIKAANIIKDLKPYYVSAGLSGDWEYTGGPIFEDGKPVPADDTYTFLASTWAIPEIDVDGNVLPCFKMQRDVPGWDEHTYWPQEALDILAGKEV